MRRVSLEDLAGPERYAEQRAAARRHIISVRRHRRVQLGDHISLVFENFETMLFQTQEMLHVEGIQDLDEIRAEIATYNELLPDEGELTATLFIQVTDEARIADELDALVGLDRHLWLVAGSERIPARFAEGRSREDRISAVQYVRFPVSERARLAFSGGTETVAIVSDHPRYAAKAELEPAQRAALCEDLGAGA